MDIDLYIYGLKSGHYIGKRKMMHVGKTNHRYNYTMKMADNDILIHKRMKEKLSCTKFFKSYPSVQLSG